MNNVSLLFGAGGIAVGTIIGVSLNEHLSSLALLRTTDQPMIESVKESQVTDASDSTRDDKSPFRVIDASACASRSATSAESSMILTSIDQTNAVIGGIGSIQQLIHADSHALSNYRELLRALFHVDGANGKQLEKLASQFSNQVAHQPASAVFVQAIFQRWAQVDVMAMIGWLNTQLQPASTGLRQFHATDNSFLMEALSGFAQASPERADEWLDSIADDQLRSMLAYRIVSEMGRQDPAAALAKLGKDEYDLSNRYSIINEWAYNDPQAALAWVQSNNDNEDRIDLEHMVFNAWLERDPEAAMEAIELLPDSPEKGYLTGRYAGLLAGNDPAKALQAAVDASQGDLLNLQASLDEIVWQWAESDLAGLRQRIESESDPELHALLLDMAGPQIASMMMYEDPLEAMSWIESLPAAQQGMIRPQVFQDWISQDKDAAISWFQQQPEPGNSQLKAAAIWHLPESHLDLALTLFPTLEPPIQSSMVNQMVYQLHSQQPHAVDSWIAGISDPRVRQIAEIAKEDLSALGNVDERIAELEYLEGEEKIDRLFELFRTLGVVEPDRIDRWMQDHPLSITEQRMLEQRAMDQNYSAMGIADCQPSYVPGMYDAPIIDGH